MVFRKQDVRPLKSPTGGAAGVGQWARPNPPSVAPSAVPGRLLLHAPELPLTLMGRPDGPWQLSQGRSGKWTPIDRAQYQPVSQWDGYSQLAITGRLLLDAWLTDDGDVVDELCALWRLEQKVDDDQIARPPWLYAVGVLPVMPTTGPVPKWVVGTCDREEQLHRTDGRCARAVATITLLEFVDPDIAIRSDPKATALTIGKTYRWKDGDTLHGVAKRELGSDTKTNAIRAANPRIKSFSAIEPGTAIQIPPRASS